MISGNHYNALSYRKEPAPALIRQNETKKSKLIELTDFDEDNQFKL